MAKKSMIARERKREKLVSKYADKRKNVLQALKQSTDFSETMELQKKLQKMPANSAKTRVRNRCWKTGRSRGVFRTFGLSRHVLREMAYEGLLPGVTKASW